MQNKFKKTVVLKSGKSTFLAVKNLIYTDASGVQLETKNISETCELQTGDRVTLSDSGNQASGEYLLPDGTKLIITEGVIQKIIAPKI